MKFSTCTLINGAETVPWLAAEGELAYSPERPPERDYFLQYSWVVPGVLEPGENKRRHYWFGDTRKDSPQVERLFRFWNKARRGAAEAQYVSHGTVASGAEVTAPLGAYHHDDAGRERLILMQHGSSYIGDTGCQPFIDRGEAVLYRGIGKAETFLLHRLGSEEARARLMKVHAQTLTDSVTSFNAVHCNLVRCETEHFNDRSFLFDGHCRENGLAPDAPPIRSALYYGYALEEWCGSEKFGPNYVKFRTPLTNIRVTTFVCNETEVKVIDPNRLVVMEAKGCRVREGVD